MKFIKKIPTALFIIIPIILVIILIYVFYVSSQKNYQEDLQIRPFSELLEMDFPELEEKDIQDPSVCDSTRIIKEWTNDKAEWINAGETKLTLLDDCWREYENEIFKFRFRDINDSIYIKYESGEFYGYSVRIKDRDPKTKYDTLFILAKGLPVDGEIKNYSTFFQSVDPSHRLLNVKKYLVREGVFLYRIEEEVDATMGPIISHHYQLSFNDKVLLTFGGESRRFMEEVLPTIELK